MSDIALEVSTKGKSSTAGKRKASTAGVSGRRASAPGIVGDAALLCGVAAVVLAAAAIGRAGDRAAAPKPAAIVESWVAIAKPVQVFSFEAPTFRGLPMTYTARRHTLGGGREDRLAFGTFGGNAPMLRVNLFRRAGEAPDATPLAGALAHAAADAGLSVVRNGLSGVVTGRNAGLAERIATRFGRVEVADLAVSGLVPSGAAGLASCSGFRLAFDRPAFSMTGLACAADGKPMPRRVLGCLIERLDLASARDDRDLIDFFAASELRRDAGCAGMGLRPNALHAAWLDDISVTPNKSLRRR